jgi:uncharacterized protein YqhQ
MEEYHLSDLGFALISACTVFVLMLTSVNTSPPLWVSLLISALLLYPFALLEKRKFYQSVLEAFVLLMLLVGWAGIISHVRPEGSDLAYHGIIVPLTAIWGFFLWMGHVDARFKRF